MTNLSLKLVLHSYTQENIHNFTQRLDDCDILFLTVFFFLKRVMLKPLKISLTSGMQVFFIWKRNYLHKDF